MLSTTFKSKLPRGLSYPIGNEGLSKALSGAPHLDDIRLSFYCHVSATMKDIHDGRPLRILYAQYNPFISVVSKSHWDLKVGAVPSVQREICHNVLLANGLPPLVEWLQSSIRPDWEPTRAKSFTVMFHLSEQSLTIDQKVWL